MKKVQQAFAVVYDDGENLAFKVSRLLEEGLDHHRAGRTGEAARLYEQVLALRPSHPDALNLLGVVALQHNEVPQAIHLAELAVQVAPTHASALTNLGNARLAGGDVDGAVNALGRSIEIDPNNADVRYNLANALRSLSRFEESLQEFSAAVSLNPVFLNAWINRAYLLAHLERHEEAVLCYERAIVLAPTAPSYLSDLGASLATLGRLDEAEQKLRVAVERFPQDSRALNNLGSLLIQRKKYEEAVLPLRKAIQIVPNDLVCRCNLAHALIKIEPRSAEAFIRETIRMNPDFARSWWLLGIVELTNGKPHEAARAFDKALFYDPTLIQEANSPGVAYNKCSRVDDAIDFYEQVVAIRPGDAEAWSDLGIAYMNAGENVKSIECHRQSLRHDPTNEFVHSNMLMILCYSPNHTSEELYQVALEWASIHTPVDRRVKLKPRAPHDRLRIGYVSPDFHDHPAGRIYEALFQHHDRSRYDVTIYANLKTADQVTKNIVACADRWRLVHQLTDEEFAAQIQEDEIDILIDLVGHTPNHRLKVFGMKPAPVQMTWLGYFATTGMSQMDFILADRHVIPVEHERYFTERPAIMPGTFYVYQPPDLAIEVSSLPALERGYVTFGCFNNTAKITPDVIRVWSEVMKRVPGSKMLLNRWPFQNEGVRQRFLKMFEENGIDSARIELRATWTREPYYRSYHEVDLMLDSFPFGASTTTTEALWMGVPVVTMNGDRFSSRMSESVMQTVGVQELPVENEEEYVALALELANDLPRLKALRETLREKTVNSPLCDFKSYARDLETTFDWMWENRSAA